ncbi:MAG: carbonic anhydrase [Alphaproteobacteria bacterium]|nr:carbonic anhydrase [Alphaproteobacteria bacterium]
MAQAPGPAKLDHLLDRNVAWAQRRTRDDPTFFVRMSEQQTPKYLWIGCSDSRVTANDVLDLDPGEVFVHRNIANVAHSSDMNLLAVLEYAVNVLRVQHVIVCGHYGCGGIERALGDDRSALVDFWLQPLMMFYRKHKAVFDALPDRRSRLDLMCEINVEMQVRRVAATPIVENAWLHKMPLYVYGWVYGTADGLLRKLGPTLSSLAERDSLVSIDDRLLMPVEPQSGVRQQAIDAFTALLDGKSSR